MFTCVALPYTVHKCSSVAVAKKTPQGLSLLTHSSEAGLTPGGRGCLWNQSQLASPAWFSWFALVGRGKGSPFQRAESWLTSTRAPPWGPGPFHRGKEDKAGGWVSPFGEELFTSLKNAERSQLLWTSLGAGSDQASKFPNCMRSPWHVMLETVAFLHLTALIWLTSDKHTLNALSLQGGGGFSPSGVLNSSLVSGAVAQRTEVSCPYKH